MNRFTLLPGDTAAALAVLIFMLDRSSNRTKTFSGSVVTAWIVRPAITFVSFWFLGMIYRHVPPAGEYPRSSASNSDMNSPSLVLPKYREPGFQYLPGRVFTHTSLAVDVASAGFVSRTLGVGGLLAMYFW
jgi:hypothetical protein